MAADTIKRLTRALDRLRNEDRYPFGLFVAEALRSFGAPISDHPPDAKLVAGVMEALTAYRIAVHESEPFEDILGTIYEEEASKSHRSATSQFFTPASLARMMAEMTLGDWRPGPSPSGGLWRLGEPACGSGGMVLASLSVVLKRYGPEALLLWDVDAADVDLTCARTCALQVMANLTLRGWSIGRIVVRHANSLSLEEFGLVLCATNGPDPEELPRQWAELIGGAPVRSQEDAA